MTTCILLISAIILILSFIVINNNKSNSHARDYEAFMYMDRIPEIKSMLLKSPIEYYKEIHSIHRHDEEYMVIGMKTILSNNKVKFYKIKKEKFSSNYGIEERFLIFLIMNEDKIPFKMTSEISFSDSEPMNNDRRNSHHMREALPLKDD